MFERRKDVLQAGHCRLKGALRRRMRGILPLHEQVIELLGGGRVEALVNEIRNEGAQARPVALLRRRLDASRDVRVQPPRARRPCPAKPHPPA